MPIHARAHLSLCLLAACSGAAPLDQSGSGSLSAASVTTATGTTDDSTGTTDSPTGGGSGLPPGTGLVVFNEVTSSGATEGAWAGKGDLVELYNPGEVAVDLSGWKLSDDATWPADKTYVFPPGSVLAGGQWLVLSAFDELSGEGDLPFGIAQDKTETLVLATADDEVVDHASFDGALAKVSYCRIPDGGDVWMSCAPTFGAENAPVAGVCGDGVIDDGEDCDGVELGGQTCDSLGLGFSGGALACAGACTLDVSGCESGAAIVVNELESGDDAIELYNAGGAPLDLSGWILTDDGVDQNYDPAVDVEKLVFPPQTSLAATGFLVVPKGEGPGQHPFGLSGDGDTVTLLRPNLEVVDQVSYAATEADVSYCRLPDGPAGTWTAGCAPTMGQPNQAG